MRYALNEEEFKARIAEYNKGRPPTNLPAAKTNGPDPSPEDARAKLITAARPLVYFEEFGKAVKLDWLVKNVLARGHNSHVFGPPGSGKSALASSTAVHLAFGSPEWHGFKIRQQCASVYFAFERADLTKKRVWAEAQRDGLGDVPVCVCPGIINLMDPKCVDEIVGTILAAEDKLGMEVGLNIFDTFNKGISAGGGDENQAKDQNTAWGHLRRVHEKMARYHLIHNMGIGHTGKDESRGSRGSNAGTGDNDVEIQISKNGEI
jgi:AAA domain-containing protein